jgi:hypothetical protein
MPPHPRFISMKSLLATLTLLTSAALAAEPVTLTLADFTALDGKPVSEGWSTDADGSLHLKGKGGHIISKEQYESFEVSWEWKVESGGNNGLKYWVAPIGEKKEWLGIEYQMIDDWKHSDGQKGGARTTASIYDIKEPAADKPFTSATDWNSSKVIVKDGKLEHWLNGKLVSALDTKSPEWTERIAKSKFKNKAGFAPGKGHLMLTDHQNETWFRNIKVKAL